jgi:hypothetical protein
MRKVRRREQPGISSEIKAVPPPPLIIRPGEDDTEQRRQQAIQNQALTAALRSWREEGDEEEQRETWAFLKAALDADRPSNRKLFP